MKIKTNSQEPGEPKDPDTAPVFDVYAAFASEEQRLEMREEFARGIAWGEAKQRLFELVAGRWQERGRRSEPGRANPNRGEKGRRAGPGKAGATSGPLMKSRRPDVDTAAGS